VLRANRPLLSVTHQVKPIPRNTMLQKVSFGRSGASLPHSQKILVAPTLMVVAFDTNSCAGMRLEPHNLAIHHWYRVGSDCGLVRIKVDRLYDHFDVRNNRWGRSLDRFVHLVAKAIELAVGHNTLGAERDELFDVATR